MSDLKKTKPFNSRCITWATGALCVACCAAPFIGIAGSATLAAFALYSESFAVAVAILGATLLVYIFISRRKALFCDLDCGCRLSPNQDGKSKID